MSGRRRTVCKRRGPRTERGPLGSGSRPSGRSFSPRPVPGTAARNSTAALRDELDADRFGDLDDVVSRGEGTGLRVDAEDVDVVGVLVGDEHPAAGRIDGEAPRVLDPLALVAGGRHPPALPVEREDSDAVMSAV